MSLAFFIAALLIFYAGFRCGASREHRDAEQQRRIGYHQAQCDMADDAAVVLDLEQQFSLPAREPR